ncbi:MAG: hypothetical protein AABX88_01115 [Nanoarchaeota archaeon]
MISIKTKINGKLIGYAEIVNRKHIEEEIYEYSVEYYRPRKNPSVIRFNLIHDRKKGAENLTILLYEQLDKELKKNNLIIHRIRT